MQLLWCTYPTCVTLLQYQLQHYIIPFLRVTALYVIMNENTSTPQYTTWYVFDATTPFYTLYVNTSRGSYVPICVGDVIHFFIVWRFALPCMYLPRKGVTAHYIIIHCPVTHPGLKKAIHGERHVLVLWGLNTYVARLTFSWLCSIQKPLLCAVFSHGSIPGRSRYNAM